MIRLGDRRNDGCPDESVSCKHGALHRACERMHSDGEYVQPSNGAGARARSVRYGGMVANR